MDLIGKAKWPAGKADHLTPAYAASIDVTVNNSLTVLEPAVLTGDATLNLTVSDETEVGALLQLKVRATTNGFDLTPGTKMVGPAIVGVAGKTKTQLYFFDGTNYVASGAAVQID